jgi:phage terminase large subunit-like protein
LKGCVEVTIEIPGFEVVKNWDAKTQQKALEVIKRRTSPDREAWYCDRGRSCDGKPHEGFDYKHARGDQWPPVGTWDYWLIMSGRGSGKTRTGSEWVRTISSKVDRIALIGRRGVDVRATMIEGESGLIYACERAGVDFEWEPSKKEFHFGNGSTAYGFSAEEPASLRGPQFGAAWLDEPAHMDLIEEVWAMLLYGLRLPGLPGGAKALLTTTPLPTPWVKKMWKDPLTARVRVNTAINEDNLDEGYIRRVILPKRGTREGRQELEGMILEDVDGALWKMSMITHAPMDFEIDKLARIVVYIDPAGSKNKRSDETGIVVAGIAAGTCWVLEDATGKYTPNGWANRAIDLYQKYNADAIGAEHNFGGDMVQATIENALKERGEFARIIVSRAMKSKKSRAEPVVGLYEQKRVIHMQGADLADLEEEMTTWIPGKGDSPNRVDAMVWAITELAKPEGITTIASPVGKGSMNAGRYRDEYRMNWRGRQ